MITNLKQQKKIYIANDTRGLNNRYRANLVKLLISEGYLILSINLYQLIKLRFFRRSDEIIISSNLRCNLITIILFYTNVHLILNGLGRFYKKKAFRIILGFFMSLGNRKIFIQNYRDYRYFRRYFQINNCEFVLGSGAVSRELGNEVGFFSVSRDNKILLCTEELKDFIEKFNAKVRVVGVNKADINFPIDLIGWVDQDRILMFGDKFVWLGGYGDGFPHSLADALYNQIETYISKREYIRLGLYKLNKKVNIVADWYIIIPQDFNELASNNVNRIYAKGLILND
jgi:hypothetical protein